MNPIQQLTSAVGLLVAATVLLIITLAVALVYYASELRGTDQRAITGPPSAHSASPRK